MAQTLATNVLGFVIVLGFLIFVHEAGHFFVAKFFKVRVLVFSFGFGKRLFGFHRGDTDYRVSLIPLGGYVRMAGDTPEDNQLGNPDEFLSKPKWQRFLILFAGPFMNIIIALAFVAGLAMNGIPEVDIAPVIGNVAPNSAAAKAGLQVGDRIVRVGTETVDEYDDLRMIMSLNAGTALTVVYERQGQTRTTTLTPAREKSEYGPVGRAGIQPWVAPLIGSVVPGSAAEQAGLRGGDRIVSINGKPVQQLGDMDDVLEKTEGKPVTLAIARGAQTVNVTLTDADEKADRRGIVMPYRVVKYPFVAALQYSAAENWRMLRFAGAAIGRMFRPEGSVRELSGPVAIAKISGETLRLGWVPLISLMAMISLQLGVMNLLPIPVLDGGHIMILLLEGIARREFSIRVKERIQQVGFAALATLMIVVLYNDVITHVLGIGKG
ncbi:MAG TPA: RIP metalloprotease RseP [Thermoanaerobaculia bacterium]